MDKKRKLKQDALILLGIVIVIAVLWRLRLNSEYGGMGSGIATNIFGPTTLTELSGSAPNGGPVSNAPHVDTNEMAASDHPVILTTNETTNSATRPLRPVLSTNLLNSNGPVTVIDVPSSDLLQTPPGVIVASTVPEAPTIEERLGAVSAQGGDVQFSLSWNNVNDLDLHCVDPKGEEIWFSNRRSRRTGGELDVDQNAHFPFTSMPVENIYWPIGGAPAGLYRVFVVYYAMHSGADPKEPTAFTVRTVVRHWKTYFFKSTITFDPPNNVKPVCTLRYDPDNPDPAKRYGFVQ